MYVASRSFILADVAYEAFKEHEGPPDSDAWHEALSLSRSDKFGHPGHHHDLHEENLPRIFSEKNCFGDCVCVLCF